MHSFLDSFFLHLNFFVKPPRKAFNHRSHFKHIQNPKKNLGGDLNFLRKELWIKLKWAFLELINVALSIPKFSEITVCSVRHWCFFIIYLFQKSIKPITIYPITVKVFDKSTKLWKRLSFKSKKLSRLAL